MNCMAVAHPRKLLLSTLLLVLSFGVQAAPDAGSIMQDNLPSTPYQPQDASVPLKLNGSALKKSDKGGMSVQVKRIEISGNSVFDDATLQAVVSDVLDSQQDMAGLREIANRLSRYYREQGYPFAHAILPQQEMKNGTLKIALFEGRYGQVRAVGNKALAARAQPWLNSLQSGEVIATEPLERSNLLLADLPGIKLIPVIRPGKAVGTGDLDVDIQPGKRLQGSAGIDNHGSKSSGEIRGQASLQINRLLTLGDKLKLTTLYTEESLWLGQIAYSLPLGYSGMRGEISYAGTEYDLGSPFEGFSGRADISSAQLSYPFIRSQQTNLSTSLSYKHKALDDRINDSSYQKRDSDSLTLAMQFDQLGKTATHYGEASITSGKLNSNADGATEGSFNYLKLNLSRLQNLSGKFSLLGNFQLQWADTSLDSSESMSAGGADGVRAYPQGEISGSRVWLMMLEVRYQASATLTPYLFFDHAQREGYQDESSEQRAGGGIGMRYSNRQWRFNAAIAARSSGKPETEEDRQDPGVWLQALYQF